MDGARRAGARSTRRRAAALPGAVAVAALLLGACGDEENGSPASATSAGGGLGVTVTPMEAAPGETVEARVENGTAETFSYGLAYMLERRDGDSFIEVAGPRVVPEIALIAEPGETGPPVSVPIPRDAKPGEYRIVIQRDVPDVGDLSGKLAVTADR